MAEEKVEVALAVTGEAVVGRALDNTANKLEGVETASKQVAKANAAVAVSQKAVTTSTEQTTAASVRATGAMAKFGPAIGIVAQGLGSMGGAAGKVTQVLAATTGAAAGLTAAFGPLGLAVAGISAAFTAYQFIVDAARKETEDLAEAQRNAVDYMREYRSAMSTEGRIRAAQEQNRANAERNALLGSEEGLLVRIQDLTEQINRSRGSADKEWFASVLERRRDLLRQELATLRETEERAGRASGAAGGARGAAGAAAPASAPDLTFGVNTEENDRSLFDRLRNMPEIGQTEGEIDRAMQFEEASARRAEAVALEAKAYDELTLAQQASAVEAERSIENAGRYTEIVGGAMIGAISAAIKGEMSLGKAIKQVVGQRLEALAIEESILAIAATAKAIGASVWNPAAAAGFWAEAASHAKAAVAAGAGAAILGGGGGGGGGSASASPAAAPTRDTSAAAPADQSRNITVYFGSPVVTATTVAELGREIKSAILTADARYGA